MLRRLRLAEPRPTFPVRSIGPVTADPSAPADSRIGIVDMLLLILFMIGIYTHYTLQVSAKIPFPSAPSGVAGMFLLWRRRNDVVPAHLAALLFVVSLYVGSILSANDLSHVGKRFTGLIQITYSLVIGYALFLTIGPDQQCRGSHPRPRHRPPRHPHHRPGRTHSHRRPAGDRGRPRPAPLGI